jgi:penicillin-binding protein activator
MNRLIPHPSSFILALLLVLAGCGSPPNNSAYIDPNGQRMIVNTDRINYQDFNMAAKSLVQDLLNSGKLSEKRPGAPSLVLISTVINDTDQQFDTDMLMSGVRIPLLQTDKVQIISNAVAGAVPDYIIAGKIMMDKTAAADVNQSAYFFDLAVTDVSTGTSVWEQKAPIVKQGRGASIGL